jgi:hypothetical protein
MCFEFVFYAIIHGLAKDEFCANSVTLTMMDLSGVSSTPLHDGPIKSEFTPNPSLSP